MKTILQLLRPRWRLNLDAKCLIVISLGLSWILVSASVASETNRLRQVASSDTSSRELVVRRVFDATDASSRELVILRATSVSDAVSRQITFLRSEQSREAISREWSLEQLGHVAVPAGFLAREYARAPGMPVQWMSLAVQPAPVVGYLDLYVATTEQQFGTAGDPPDDHLYRVIRGTLQVQELLSFAASETDPVDIAFSGGGAFGTQLYVVARHADGYQPGDMGGGILRIDTAGNASSFFSEHSVATAPYGIAVGTPAATGFTEALYCVNGATSPHALFAIDPSSNVTGFTADQGEGFQCISFGPGGGYGAELFAAGAGGVVYRIDAAGQVIPFSPGLGAPVHALAFSRGYGFDEWLYALLGNGSVVRVGPTGQPELFLAGLLIEPIAEDVVRNDLAFTPAGDILYVSDARRGVVYSIQAPLPTAAPPSDGAPMPRSVALGNHPNPFNPATTVSFRLEQTQRVELYVFDVRGRLVHTLIDGETLEPGAHERQWDGRDDHGATSASGVYFAQLRSEGASFGHKMVLLK